MNSRHVYPCLVLAFSGFLGVATAQPAGAKYISSVTTGMVGLAATQTAQLNVLNLAPPTLSTSPVALCAVELSFYDTQNRLLNSSTATVAPGAAASLALGYLKLPPVAIGFHPLIRGVVRTLAVPSPVAASSTLTYCNLFVTLELFDSMTGVSHVVTSDTRPNF